jgi:hypothetical protein
MFVVALLCAALVAAFPDGSQVCSLSSSAITMNRARRPTETFGVTLSSNATQYGAGDAVRVTLASASSAALFCGFVLAAEDASGRRVGAFELAGNAARNVVGCDATITHRTAFGASSQFSAVWRAAADVGAVTFSAVILSGARGNATEQTFYWPTPLTVASSRPATPMPTAAAACAAGAVGPRFDSAACPEQQAGIVPWSEWRRTAPQSDWQNVTVPAGTVVLLDVSPPKLHRLDIYGQLVVDPSPTARISLRARFIHVRACAHLWVGSRACPALGAVEIELHGDPAPKVDPDGHGTKVLAGEPGSSIDIHGAPIPFAWTQLSAHAGKGARSVVLADVPVGWNVNDEIVIASTQFGDSQSRRGRNERRTLAAVSGRTLSWNGPALATSHYGQVFRPAGAPADHSVDMRAEVALLTRNVKIHGDVSGASFDAGWGGHIMVVGNAELRIQDAELFDMGQAGELARYPIHYHVTGNNSNSYVVRNSIHDTFQRCVTVHGTNQLLVQGNAAFNAQGHCYFIEDGDEVDNVFDRNLGIDPQPHTLLDSDREPAVFWVTNPTNHFYRNRAVGGAFGWWYAMPLHPTGKAANRDTQHKNWPIYAPFGDFVDNAAHGQRSGLFVDRGLNADGKSVQSASSYVPVNLAVAAAELDRLKALGRADEINPLALGERLLAMAINFTSYKQSEFGVWARGAGFVVHNARIADCLVGVSMPQGGQVAQSSVFIGETDNDVTEAPLVYWRDAPQIGYRSYDTGIADLALRNTFYDYRTATAGFEKNAPAGTNRIGTRHAGAFSGQTGPNTLPPYNLLLGSTFVRVDNAVLYYREDLVGDGSVVDLRDYDPATKGIVHYDVDGTLTGQCGAAVVGSSALLRHSAAACVERPAWRAFVCSGAAASALQYFEFDATENAWAHVDAASRAVVTVASDSQLHIARLGSEPANMTQRPYPSAAYPCPTAQDPQRICYASSAQWNTNLLSGHDYLVSLLGLITPKMFRVATTFVAQNEWVRVRVPAPVAPDAVLNGDRKPTPRAASLAAVNATSPWFWDATTQLLTLHLQPHGGIFQEFESIGDYGVALWTVSLIVDLRSCTGANELADAAGRRTFCRAPAPAAAAPVGGLAAAAVPSRCGFTSQFARTAPAQGGAAPLVVYPAPAASPAFPLVTAGVSGVSVAAAGTGVSGGSALAIDWPLPGIEVGPNLIQAVLFRSATPINRAAYTHLHFRVKSAPGQGRRIKLLVTMTRALDFDTTVGSIINVAAPANGGDGFIDEDAWGTYNVPIDTIETTSPLTQQIIFFGAEQRAVKLFIDDVRFVSGVTERVNRTGWPSALPPSSVSDANLRRTLPPAAPRTTTTAAASTVAATTLASTASPSTTAVSPVAECRATIIETCKRVCSSASLVRSCACAGDGSPSVVCANGTQQTAAPGTGAPATSGTPAQCVDLLASCRSLCGEQVASCRCTNGAPDVTCDLATTGGASATPLPTTTELVLSASTAAAPLTLAAWSLAASVVGLL